MLHNLNISMYCIREGTFHSTARARPEARGLFTGRASYFHMTDVADLSENNFLNIRGLGLVPISSRAARDGFFAVLATFVGKI